MVLGDSIRRLSGKIVLRRGRGQLRDLRELAPHVRHIQRWLLQEKIDLHRATAFGRDHGFATIRSVWDFRRQLPIATYDAYEPYIEQLQHGNIRALLGPREKLLMFALTSGTTNAPKLIPITRRFMDEYRRGWTMWGTQVVCDHPETIENPPHFRPKRILHLASRFNEFQTPAGTPCGAISGLMARLQRPVVRSIYCLPHQVLEISDAQAKYYTILRLAIPEVVGKLVTANPSTLVTLARLGDQWKDMLIRDIAQGTLDAAFDVPRGIRVGLRRRLCKPNPALARRLEHIVHRTGTLYPKDYWPSLKLIGTWTGGTVSAYVDHLPRYYGPVPVRDIGLLASEGRMTIPLENGTPAGILDFLNTYFEFIPAAEIDSLHPTVLEAHELESDGQYYVVLTTSGGLFRYHIQDLVRCVDFCGNTPVLEFLNKGSQFSSLTGEKLSEYQVVRAVRRASEELRLSLSAFILAPCMSEPSYYVLLVEHGDCTGTTSRSAFTAQTWCRAEPAHGLNPRHFALSGSSNSASHSRTSGDVTIGTAAPSRVQTACLPTAQRLAARLDQLLQQQNCEFAAKRRSGRLGPVRVRLVPAGTWHRFHSRQRALRGGTLEQYKPPCLVEDLSFLSNFPTLAETVDEVA